MNRIIIGAYHCPSKRGPTRGHNGAELMDYAAAVPSRPRSKFGRGPYTYVNDDPTWGTVGCAIKEFWGVVGGDIRFEQPDIQSLTPAKLANAK